MKKLIAILFFTMLPATVLFAQQQAMIRAVESQAKRLTFLTLTYDTGESEEIELESLGLGFSAEKLIANQKTIMKTMRKLSDQGYELTHLSSTGEAIMTTIMVFSKRE